MTALNSLISIIMPAFNAGKTLDHSIQNALRQSYQNFELIVVDDGSTDDTAEIVKKWSQVDNRVKLIQQKNKGAGPARNTGLKHAEGDFIAFLDADDSWDPSFLVKMHENLAQNPDAALVYCGWQNLGLPKGDGKPYVPVDYESTNKIVAFLSSCPWPIHAALTRARAITEVGSFDESFSSCMDYDLWLRVATFNKIVLVPEVLAFYHFHGGEQITKNKARLAFNHLLVQKKFVRQHPNINVQVDKKELDRLTRGELLHRGYDAYWKGNLEAARLIFRKCFFIGYFSISDLKYLIPSLAPYTVFKWLVKSTRKTL